MGQLSFKNSKTPIRDAIGQLAVFASIFFAVAYPLDIIPINPILVKGAAVSFLAIFVLLKIASIDHALLFIALIAGATGDMQLEVQEPDAFINGLKDFLVGHIFYILIFIRNRLSVYDVSRTRINLASLLWALVAVGAIWAWPNLGEGKMHIAAYTAGILGMATAAVISRYPIKLVGVGAGLFIFSDAIIGAELITIVPEWLSDMVWPLYYLAQFLITMGIALTPLKKKNGRAIFR